MYISSTISYVRHKDEEAANTNMIIITCQGLGIEMLYRTYKLMKHTHHQNAFEEQFVVF